MARFNEILVGHFNRGLQKLTGIKGGVPAPQLASEIIPIVSLPLGVEYRYLDSWDSYGASVSTTGGVATLGSIRLRNPSTSNVIAVVVRITVLVVVADSPVVNLSTTATDLTPFTTQALDSRSRKVGTLIASQGNVGAVPGIQVWNGSLSGRGSLDVILSEIQEIPLLPGSTIEIANGSVNIALGASIWWRERYLEESERA